MEKKRISVFIDGFNLYHAIDRHLSARYKWCNLKKLAEQFIDGEKEEIGKVYFVTAYCIWDNEKLVRHKNYVKALRQNGIYTIKGNYRKVQRTFRIPMQIEECVPIEILKIIEKLVYRTHEEKETDVNIALKIVEEAFLNHYDHAIILSGDSDLIGAIKTVKKHFPDKEFTNLLPIKAKGKIIGKVCGKQYQITKKHFDEALMPEEINLENGEIIKMPEKYKEP